MARLSLPLAVLFVVSACPSGPIKLPDPDKVVVDSFTANKTEVEAGSPVTLSWATTGADTISLRTADGRTVEGVAETTLDGSVEVTPEKTTTYVLTARGKGGSDSRMLSVRTPGGGEGSLLVALPASVAAGASSTLVWNVAGAESVVIKDAAGQSVAEGGASGAVAVHPRMTTTYTLEASGRTAQATVQVLPGVISFQSDKATYDPGETVTLTWSTGGARQLTVLAEGRSEALVVHQDSAEVFSGSVTDVVPELAPADGVMRYVLRLQEGERTVESTIEVYTGALPRVQTFNVPRYVRLDSDYTASWTTQKAQRIQVIVGGEVVYETQEVAEARQGSVPLPGLTAQSVVELRAFNSAGMKSEPRDITPLGPPSLTAFTVDKTVVAAGGEPVMLSWDVQDGRHVRISIQGGKTLLDLTGEQAKSGVLKHFPNGRTTYVIEADNTLTTADGQLQAIMPATQQVTVTTPGQLLFTPEPAAVGAKVKLVGTTVPGATAVLGLPVMTKNRPGDSFIDISQTGTPVSIGSGDRDTTAKLVTLSRRFTIPLFGSLVEGNSISVSPNGWFALSSTAVNGETVPSKLPGGTTAVPFVFAPFYGDLNFPVEGVGYYWQLDSVGGEDRLIVQWAPTERWLEAAQKIEMQVQLYASGRVVYAYKNFQMTDTAFGSIGLVDGTSKSGMFPDRTKVESGDTISFFHKVTFPLDEEFTATGAPVRVSLEIPGGSIDIVDAPELLPVNGISISEVMFKAPAGAEWFEVRNHTNAPFDLTGFSFEMTPGKDVGFSVPDGTVIPVNGAVVFSQTADLGGDPVVTPAHVYGTDILLDDTAGTITAKVQGVSYAKSEWSSSTLVPNIGEAVRFDYASDDRNYNPSTLPNLTCAASTAFGTHSRKGTPGTVDGSCWPYRLQKLPAGDFESLLGGAGVPLVLTPMGSLPALDEGIVTLPQGPMEWAPLKIGYETFNNIYVSSNGFLTLETFPTSATNAYYSNRTSLTTTGSIYKTIAPFWDALVPSTLPFAPDQTPGIYYKRDAARGVTIVSWEHYAYRDTSCSSCTNKETSDYNFQVKFFDTGDIEFHYGAMLAPAGDTSTYHRGDFATSWLESTDGKLFSKINVNSTSPGIQPNSGYRFKFQP